MRNKLCMLLFSLCLVSMTACGNKTVSEDSNNNPDSSHNEKTTTEAADNDSAKEEINIEDIAWNIDEGIVDGERYILLNFTNNTPYTIAEFEIKFKEKSDITEEEKSTFYSDIQKMTEASDDEINEAKEYPISMYTKSKRAIEPGESATNVNCYYYSGYYYLKDINHYNLVEPDIATIKYVEQGKIYTVYYDYNSKKYSAESETEVAYQWSQTDLSSKIPKPDVKIVKNDIDTESIFMFDAYGISIDQFNAYVEECKALGYTVEPSDFEGYYSADNTEGYGVDLNYNEDDYTINGTVSAPSENSDKE